MVFCVSCRHLSPAGSQYCGYCARSINRTFCGNGHANQRGVRSCTACGSAQLSDSARGIRLTWIGTVLAAVLLLFIWKAALPFLGRILCFLFCAGISAVAFALNMRAACLLLLLREAAAWIVVLYLIGLLLQFVPGGGGSVGRWLRGLPLRLLQAGWRAAVTLGKWVARSVQRLVLPPADRGNAKDRTAGRSKKGSNENE